MKTVYHIGSGATQFPYDVDADNALRLHPREWSKEPWSVDETNAYRRAQYDAEVEAAGRENRPIPPAPPEVVLTEQQQSDIAEDEKNRAEARHLVTEYDEKKRAEIEYEDKVSAARALLASPRQRADTNPPLVHGQPQGAALAGPLEIPDGWRDLSPSKRRAMAMRLGASATVKADEADKAIEAEIERRGEQRNAELAKAAINQPEAEQRDNITDPKPSATFETPAPKPPAAPNK